MADEEPRWLDEGEARAWRSYLRMHHVLHAQLERELNQASGLSLADFGVLANLSEAADHRLRMSELAARMQWSKSRLSHQVGRMEQRGLLVRAECATDGRGAFATLTATGLATIVRAAPGHVAAVRRHLLDRLTPEQLQALAEISEAVVAPLDDAATPCTDDC